MDAVHRSVKLPLPGTNQRPDLGAAPAQRSFSLVLCGADLHRRVEFDVIIIITSRLLRSGTMTKVLHTDHGTGDGNYLEG
jgi:hypothetical protein